MCIQRCRGNRFFRGLDVYRWVVKNSRVRSTKCRSRSIERAKEREREREKCRSCKPRVHARRREKATAKTSTMSRGPRGVSGEYDDSSLSLATVGGSTTDNGQAKGNRANHQHKHNQGDTRRGYRGGHRRCAYRMKWGSVALSVDMSASSCPLNCLAMVKRVAIAPLRLEGVGLPLRWGLPSRWENQPRDRKNAQKPKATWTTRQTSNSSSFKGPPSVRYAKVNQNETRNEGGLPPPVHAHTIWLTFRSQRNNIFQHNKSVSSAPLEIKQSQKHGSLISIMRDPRSMIRSPRRRHSSLTLTAFFPATGSKSSATITLVLVISASTTSEWRASCSKHETNTRREVERSTKNTVQVSETRTSEDNHHYYNIITRPQAAANAPPYQTGSAKQRPFHDSKRIRR